MSSGCRLKKDKCKTDVFKHLDVNGDGALNETELTDAMRRLKLTVHKDDLSSIVKQYGSKGVDFKDFVTIMDKQKRQNSGTRLQELFQTFDKDQSGFISFEELKSALKDLGYQLSDQEVHELIAEADKDGDGMINYQEFINQMMKSG